MQKVICFLLSAFSIISIVTAQNNHYAVTKTFHIKSSGGWDYLAVNNNKLYVSHGFQVNILHEDTGDSLGVIENTSGVHGIAFVNGLNKGYTSNGRTNNVTVFDLQTDKVITQVSTGENPDAILYDNFSKKIFTCNGRSKDLTVIDAATDKVVKTIAVGGKPETAVSDDNGNLFVNIEDKNEIVEISTKTLEVSNHWSLAPGEAPTGLAFDKVTKRLFAACGDNKLLIVMDAVTGKVVAKLPIGGGCDGAAFDPADRNIFTSNGEGTVTVIHENTADDYKVLENIVTKPRARTIAINEKTHHIYLPTAEFETLAPNAAKNERPKMIAGSFQVLVIDKK